MIDEPRYVVKPVAPVKPLVYLGGLFGGLLLPFFFSLGRQMYSSSYLDTKTLKDITDIPVIGIIPKTRKRNKIVVQKDSSTPLAERFRIARANLQYPRFTDKQVIAVTSSTKGEGKTFASINLALCFALTKQKTIIVDMNLRDPKIDEYLGHNGHNIGLTDYINGQIPLSNIIYQYEDEPSLHYIPSGQLALNPHELLMEKQVGQMFMQLIEKYDIILIDTPAVGEVADTFLLNEFVTKTVYVVKEGKTTKRILGEADELLQNKVLQNPFLLVNATNSSNDLILSYGSVESEGVLNGQHKNWNTESINQPWKKII